MTGFKAFLTNIDYNVENLDFLLYIQHYTNLFEAVADEERSALSPPWTKEDEEAAKKAIININKISVSRKSIPSVIQAQPSLPTPPGSSGNEYSQDFNYEEFQSTPPQSSDGRHVSMGRSMSDAEMDAIAPFAKLDSLSEPVEAEVDKDVPAGPELPSKYSSNF